MMDSNTDRIVFAVIALVIGFAIFYAFRGPIIDTLNSVTDKLKTTVDNVEAPTVTPGEGN